MAPAPSIRWDIVEEHLDEAAFLHAQWERALVDPEYALREVLEGPEERMHAHLDGLVVAGRRAVPKLLLPALEGDDPDAAFAAAYALLASEDGDFTDPVLKALAGGEPEEADAIVRALQIAPRADLAARLGAVLATGSPPAQARALRVLAFRRMDPGRLDRLAATGDGELRASLLLAMRVFPACAPQALLDHALRSTDVAERALAMETGLVLGAKQAWAACEEGVRAGGPGWDRAALLYALSGERDVGPLVAVLGDPDRTRAALLALGFTGRVAAAEAVLSFIADEPWKKLAAEAFSAVTGLAIAGRHAERGKRWDPDAPDEDDEGGGPEADLPAPAAAEVETWWNEARPRFDPGQRWLAGKPWSIGGVLAELDSGPMRRRPALALDLAIRSRGQHQLEATATARRQIAELTEIRRAPPRAAGTYQEELHGGAARLAAPKPV